MDKALFRAYVKELVREQIEDSVETAVKKILPKLLQEAVEEVKTVQNTTPSTKQKFSRTQLAEMMGLERIGDTVIATTKNLGPVMSEPPQGVDINNPAFQAINKDYSGLMKKMGLSK